jgi:hypothetical protein
MRNFKILFLSFALILSTTLGVIAQENRMYDERGIEYTFQIPDEKWKDVPKGADVRAATEIIYGDRLDGFLQIRKTTLDEDSLTPLNDIIERETTQKLQFLSGYVAGKEESFTGALKGKVLNYEFVQAGKNMSGRIYFLQADKKTFYILRFTGLRDKLKLIRVDTDMIARTFKMKEAKKDVAK